MAEIGEGGRSGSRTGKKTSGGGRVVSIEEYRERRKGDSK